MKNILILSALLFVNLLVAQAPQSFKYQAVVRDNSGELIKNQAVSFQITIRKNGVSGTPVYIETFNVVSDLAGLVNLSIGTGLPTQGIFANIAWADGTYFIETAIDFEGGTNYEILGTTQFLSVPFAFHTNTAGAAVTKTKTERDQISTPTTGQLLFCTNCGAAGELQVYNGTTWTNLMGGTAAE